MEGKRGKIYRLSAEGGPMWAPNAVKPGKVSGWRKGSAARPYQKWSMNFVAQRLVARPWIRVLTVVDQFAIECSGLFADVSLSRNNWQRRRTRSSPIAVQPQSITMDNDTDFVSKAVGL
jgi:hypothetical protein